MQAQNIQLVFGSLDQGILATQESLQLMNAGIPAISLNNSKKEVDFGGHMLTNIQTGINKEDIATIGYVDSQVMECQRHLQLIVGDAPDILNSLQELANAIGNDGSLVDHIDQQMNGKVDRTEINSLIQQFNTQFTIDTSGNRIVNVGNAIGPLDAVNKQQLDQKNTLTIINNDNDKIELSVLNTNINMTKNNTLLQTIYDQEVSTFVKHNMNNNILYNLPNATQASQPLTYGQSLQHQWTFALLSNPIQGPFLPIFIVPFDLQLYPENLQGITRNVSQITGLFVVLPGKYLVTFSIQCQYNESTDLPVIMRLSSAQTGIYPYLNIVTNRAWSLQSPVYTTASTIIQITQPEQISMQLVNTEYLSLIDMNTQVQLQQIY